MATARYKELSSRYEALVARVRKAETARTKGMTGLAEAVARHAYKLMAYKDEYEVARLYALPDFWRELSDTFEGGYKIHLHLAPPLIAERDPVTGRLVKNEYGPWILTAFRLLAKLKGLRGTPFDIFGYTAERRTERRLIAEYEQTIETVLKTLSHDNHALAVEIASLPERIRGFGHVKEQALAATKAREAQLLEMYKAPATRVTAAE